MKKLINNSASILCALSLLGCGSGGSSSSPPDTTTRDIQKNVALTASTTATYDSGNSNLVVDGDSTVSNFWAGNIAGDNLVIDLGKVIPITKIVVYTNDTSISSSNPSKTFEVSTDGTNWSETLLLSGGDIPCESGFSIGSGKIECDIRKASFSGNVVDDSEKVRYFRVTLNTSDVKTIQLYEVEITGWVEETTINN